MAMASMAVGGRKIGVRGLPAHLSSLPQVVGPTRHMNPAGMYHGSGMAADMDVTLGEHKSEMDVNPSPTIKFIYSTPLSSSAAALNFNRGEPIWRLRDKGASERRDMMTGPLSVCGMEELIAHFRKFREERKDFFERYQIEFVGVFLNNRKVSSAFPTPRSKSSIGVFGVEGFHDVLPYWGRDVMQHMTLFFFIVKHGKFDYKVHPFSCSSRNIDLAASEFAQGFAKRYPAVGQEGGRNNRANVAAPDGRSEEGGEDDTDLTTPLTEAKYVKVAQLISLAIALSEGGKENHAKIIANERLFTQDGKNLLLFARKSASEGRAGKANIESLSNTLAGFDLFRSDGKALSPEQNASAVLLGAVNELLGVLRGETKSFANIVGPVTSPLSEWILSSEDCLKAAEKCADSWGMHSVDMASLYAAGDNGAETKMQEIEENSLRAVLAMVFDESGVTENSQTLHSFVGRCKSILKSEEGARESVGFADGGTTSLGEIRSLLSNSDAARLHEIKNNILSDADNCVEDCLKSLARGCAALLVRDADEEQSKKDARSVVLVMLLRKLVSDFDANRVSIARRAAQDMLVKMFDMFIRGSQDEDVGPFDKIAYAVRVGRAHFDRADRLRSESLTTDVPGGDTNFLRKPASQPITMTIDAMKTEYTRVDGEIDCASPMYRRSNPGKTTTKAVTVVRAKDAWQDNDEELEGAEGDGLFDKGSEERTSPTPEGDRIMGLQKPFAAAQEDPFQDVSFNRDQDAQDDGKDPPPLLVGGTYLIPYENPQKGALEFSDAHTWASQTDRQKESLRVGPSQADQTGKGNGRSQQSDNATEAMSSYARKHGTTGRGGGAGQGRQRQMQDLQGETSAVLPPQQGRAAAQQKSPQPQSLSAGSQGGRDNEAQEQGGHEQSLATQQTQPVSQEQETGTQPTDPYDTDPYGFNDETFHGSGESEQTANEPLTEGVNERQQIIQHQEWDKVDRVTTDQTKNGRKWKKGTK